MLSQLVPVVFACTLAFIFANAGADPAVMVAFPLITAEQFVVMLVAVTV